nr:hypothetical protein CFP56_48712 [Quercus suber]
MSYTSKKNIFQNLEELSIRSEVHSSSPRNMVLAGDGLFPSVVEEILPVPISPLSSIECHTNVHTAEFEAVEDQQWEHAWIVDDACVSGSAMKHDSFSPSPTVCNSSMTGVPNPGLKTFIHDTDACLPSMSHLNMHPDQQKRPTMYDSFMTPYEGSLYATQSRELPNGSFSRHASIWEACENWSVKDKSPSPVSQPERGPSDYLGRSYSCGDVVGNVGDMVSDVQSDGQFSPPPDDSEAESAGDEFIVALRRKNVPYEEIRRRGRFKTAVSTLRGRYRNATKPKKDRPRRQLWQREDVSCRL